tara:strand:+ start:673 stop:996 length:324 start_codon:yes stop_codon:yes gene_type:complete
MKKLLLMVIVSLISIKSYSQSYNIPPFKRGGDKILHFTCSYIIQYNSYNWLEPRLGKKKAKLYSTLLTLGIGASKEIIDQKFRKGWEAGDMYANSAAIMLFRIELGR